MFKKLKKKLEEGEEGGMDFTPRRLPGSVVRSSSGDASMVGTDSDVAAGAKEGEEDRSLSRDGFDVEWYSTDDSRELAVKVKMVFCVSTTNRVLLHSHQTTSQNI